MIIKVAALLICASLTSPVYAQPTPDLAGTWALDEKRSGSATHEAFVGPVVWVIQQTSDALVLERRRGETVSAFTYPIRQKEPTPGPTPVAPTADGPGHRAHWDGERLIIETHQTVQGKTVTTRESLTLAEGGQELVVERVLEVEHGYTLKGAQNYSAVKDVFTKRH